MDEQEEVLKIPSEKNFALSKVKIVKDGGLDVHFEVTEVINEESYINKYHVESAKDIHPDLRNCFKELMPIVGRIFNVTSFLTMIEADEFKASANQEKASRNFAKELIEKIEVRGISLSGNDDNVAVIITSVLEVLKGQKVCINSPRIKFSNDNYGFEEELEDIILRIEQEAYQFLFKGKKAQLELFGSSPVIKKGEKEEEFFGEIGVDESQVF